MLDRERERSKREQQRREGIYERQVAEHYRELQKRRQRRDAARLERRWWAWLRATASLWVMGADPPRRPAPMRVDRNGQARLAAGIEGEAQVARHLAERLGQEWVLLCGYRNQAGEIDQLLLGPSGLFAIEVKHRNATVFCDQDEWRFEKYDRYGNRVREGWITDRRGRSPSKQLNDPASRLEEFLGRRGQPVPIDRTVLLTHPRAQIGACHEVTVNIATKVDFVLGQLSSSRVRLDQARCGQIERLICRDHDFHDGRRAKRRGGQDALSSERA